MSNLPTVPLADIERMAVYVAESKMFPGVDTKQKAAALMLLVQGENLHPMKALERYHLMEFKNKAGDTCVRPTLKADVMLANFQEAGGTVEWKVYTDECVTGIFKHPKGGEVPVTWDVKRVQAANLSGLHYKFGAAMKRSRCISEGVRTVYPGCLHGLYTPEEMSEVIEAEIVPPTPPRKPAKKIETPTVPSLPDVAPTPDPEPLDRSAQAEYTKELGAMLRALINPETVANEIKARYELKGKLTEVTDLATRYNILADLNEALASQKESLEAA
jgi:hypothetical protein